MNKAGWIRLAGLLVLVLVIEAACRLKLVSAFILIPPSAMAVGLWKQVTSGGIGGDIASSLFSILMAAVGAIAVGFLAGVALQALPRARRVLDPLLATYYAIPTFVFYPLFIVFFGLGNDMPKRTIGFMFAVVAMMTNTLNGLDRVPRVFGKTARVMGLTRAETVRHIVLPAAAPAIFTGVKFAIAYAFVGVLGAEFILSDTGIGHQISFAFDDFDNPKMYGLILLVVILVAAVNSILFAWERALMKRRRA